MFVGRRVLVVKRREEGGIDDTTAGSVRGVLILTGAIEVRVHIGG